MVNILQIHNLRVIPCTSGQGISIFRTIDWRGANDNKSDFGKTTYINGINIVINYFNKNVSIGRKCLHFMKLFCC